MSREREPVDHQPAKEELGEEVRIDASPDELAFALTCGGAPRRESSEDAGRK